MKQLGEGIKEFGILLFLSGGILFLFWAGTVFFTSVLRTIGGL
jgi:hypothetical protein